MSEPARVQIAFGAWIGIAGLVLTVVLALFGAAGWVVTRIDRLDTRIDGLDTRIDGLAVDVAHIRGQLDILVSRSGSSATLADLLSDPARAQTCSGCHGPTDPRGRAAPPPSP